jgi:hypothetical protein
VTESSINIVEKAIAIVQHYPGLAYRKTNRSVVVDAPSTTGFPVCLYTGGNQFVVHFSGWHEHFGAENEALQCFQFGLAGQRRPRNGP